MSDTLNKPRIKYLLLLVLFVGSGCAALIYEIVWFQMLQLSMGSTAFSLAVLLGTFMGGMCIGSLGYRRFVSSQLHPLRVYAWIETCIGLLGLAMLWVLPWVASIYTSFAFSSSGSLPLRAVVSTACLLPPTVLMGATLPAIASWLERSPRAYARLGMFYSANICGAVVGCLAAGFLLLRVYDVTVATMAGVAVNFAVAAIAFVLARTHTASSLTEVASRPSSRRSPISIYIASALSGMCALGSEVVWTRALSLMLGATVYTFSLILAAFLVGLGIGSTVASAFVATKQARCAFGLCQLALVIAIAWANYCITTALPFLVTAEEVLNSPWRLFQVHLNRCFWTMLPAACLWGASFPLAVSAAAQNSKSELSQVVGRMYAANTVGAIAGSVVFSLLMTQWLGTQDSQRVVMLGCLMASVILLWPHYAQLSRLADLTPTVAVTVICACIFGSSWLILTIKPLPNGLIGMGRELPTDEIPRSYIYVGEGMNASVAISDTISGERHFHVSGKVVASSGFADMRLQGMLCHLPALMHPKCESVLVVGCGAGVTAGSFVIHPYVKRIVICEIEPLIPKVAGKFFGDFNYQVMTDPRVEVVHDDARHFIATTREKFDVITSDPIHPWVKGAAAIYSLEYFRLCQKRLNPGGIATQWVPLYETSLAGAKSQIATFSHAFPQSSVWGNLLDGEGYDVVMLGSLEPFKIDVNELAKKLRDPAYLLVADSLAELNVDSAVDLLSTYAGGGRDLQPWLAHAQINRDRNMRLQYIAGLSHNQQMAPRIYAGLLKHQSFPSDLITGRGELLQRLKQRLTGSTINQ